MTAQRVNKVAKGEMGWGAGWEVRLERRGQGRPLLTRCCLYKDLNRQRRELCERSTFQVKGPACVKAPGALGYVWQGQGWREP